MIFNRILNLLTPNGHAWQLKSPNIKSLIDGVTPTFQRFVDYVDGVYFDQFPQTTRFLSDLEQQHGLTNSTGLTEQERRDRLEAVIRGTETQSPRELQDLLQASGFDVYVHEWWQVPVVGTPVPRNPNLYLQSTSSNVSYISTYGEPTMTYGEPTAVYGAFTSPVGYILKKKTFVRQVVTTSTYGEPTMTYGEPTAVYGGTDVVFLPEDAPVPSDPSLWPFFVYIGGSVFPQTANVENSRRQEFETLCLKIFPAHMCLGILIQYL